MGNTGHRLVAVDRDMPFLAHTSLLRFFAQRRFIRACENQYKTNVPPRSNFGNKAQLMGIGGNELIFFRYLSVFDGYDRHIFWRGEWS